MTEEQLESRMHVRMHIIEESKMEINEMPQEWYTCPSCSSIQGENAPEEYQQPTRGQLRDELQLKSEQCCL